MPELLLEILSEEIPARMQARAADDLKRLVMEGLKEAGLEFTGARAFATPRRLALVVDGLPERQPDVSEERRGPQVGAPERAIEGFLGSVGLALDQCEKREVKGKEFWFAVVEKKGGPVSEVLAEILPRMLPALPWPKSMRWGKGETRWVRPIHNLLGIFSGGGLASGAFGLPFRMTTLGHRFMEPEPITVTGFADYNAKLRKAKVILDAGERAALIESEAEKIAAKEGLALRSDPGLLAEVAGLVEWPVVLMGAIDGKFMDLPPEVLTQAMRAHQKYFALTDEAGRLAPRFIVVANTETADGGKAVVAGNERVLRARLSDARFFWDTDRKEKLEARVARLGGVVFHAKLGTLAEKVDRMESLAAELAESIPGAEKNAVTRAAHLAKADLVTGIVGEFPELQGVMGRYYALEDGESAEVADAIADHYAPQGPHDRCPSAPVSVAVALADKIDSLVGFFAIDEKPTGSRDPFALRRAALGVIRIVTENGLRLPLTQTFDAAERGYGGSRKCFEGALDPGDLLAFFADRLKVQMREQGVRHDLIEAVFATPKPEGGTEDDLVRLLARVAALTGFLATDDGANLLTAYKRAANIVRIEERKDKTSYEGEADPKLLVEDEEKALQGALEGARASLDAALANEDFAAAMAELAKLRGPVDAFFDRVTVNCGDEKLRANRLRLLGRIRAALNLVADFSRIEG